MKRNLNIEMFRAVAIIYMLLYHFMISMPQINTADMSIFIESLGQFALISFFVLSGYGTFCLFEKMENLSFVVFIKYLKRRLYAILPQYYFCIGVLLLLTSRVTLLQMDGKNGIKIIENLLLLQNFDVSAPINGVTWTIAVLFQLYLIAIPLYKILKKYKAVAWVLVTLGMCILKRYIFAYIGAHDIEPLYYVVTSIRIPFTTVALFLTGMFAAQIASAIKAKATTPPPKNRWDITGGVCRYADAIPHWIYKICGNHWWVMAEQVDCLHLA